MAATATVSHGLDSVLEILRRKAPEGFERHLLLGHVRRGRDLLRARASVHREAPFPTGVGWVDAGLEGGLERGALTEVVGARSCGRFALVLSTLARATGAGQAAALVDLGDGLDPATAVAAGCALERLLWIRPRRLREALASMEIALGGGFPLVVADLGPPPLLGTRGVENAWLRLRHACARHRAALLVSTPYRVSGPAAYRVFSLTAQRGGVWRGTGREPRLLAGLETRIEFEPAASALDRGQRTSFAVA